LAAVTRHPNWDINVPTAYATGRFAQIFNEMKRYDLIISGIRSEKVNTAPRGKKTGIVREHLAER